MCVAARMEEDCCAYILLMCLKTRKMVIFKAEVIFKILLHEVGGDPAKC